MSARVPAAARLFALTAVTALSVDIAHQSALADPLDPGGLSKPGIINELRRPILWGDFDTDGDGVPEIIIAVPPDEAGAPGSVEVRSGATDNTLFAVTAESPDIMLGTTVARGCGDVNGDGHDDLLIDTVRPDAATPDAARTSVRVHSGADGALLYELQSSVDFDGFGVSAAPINDINDDGRPDLLIGAAHPGADPVSMTGRAFVYSGVDGNLLYTLTNPSTVHRFGESVTTLGDLDNDGHGDFAVSAPGIDQEAGQVFIYSGSTGAVLRSLQGGPGDLFGASISSVDDYDGDGVADLAVSDPLSPAGFDNTTGLMRRGHVRVYSAVTGSPLTTRTGEPGVYYGATVTGMSLDWDFDGTGDLVIGDADTTNPQAMDKAHVSFVSTKTGVVLGEMTPCDLMKLQSPAPLLGDANGDGAVTATDLAVVIGGVGRPAPSVQMDPTRDGVTDIRDVRVVLDSLGDTEPPDDEPAPLPALGVFPTGTCRNVAIAAAGTAGVLYFGCGLAFIYNPFLGLACFNFITDAQSITYVVGGGLFGCAAG